MVPKVVCVCVVHTAKHPVSVRACSLSLSFLNLFILHPDRNLPSLLSSHSFPPPPPEPALNILQLRIGFVSPPPAHEGSRCHQCQPFADGEMVVDSSRKWLAPALHSDVFAQWMAEK